MDDLYQTVVNQMNGLNEPDVITSLQNEEQYMINFNNEISKLSTFREDLGTYDRECNDGLADLKELISIVLNATKQLSDAGVVIAEAYEPEGMFDGLTKARLRILLDRSRKFKEENETEIESAYQHYNDIWNDIKEELRKQRLEKGYQLVMTSIAAIGATVLTFGALGPEMISVETAVLGTFALCFDTSNLVEGSQELYYGCTGDVETVAFNPVRDTYFLGWQEGYDVATFGVNMGFGYCSTVDLAVASEIRAESALLEDIGGGGKTNFENEIPRSGSEWDAYLRGRYGDENVVWESKGGKYSTATFATDDKLVSHFEKHGNEFKGLYNSADEYLQGARDVMNNGYKVEYSYKGEIRTGFVQFMGNNSKGKAKFAFVGTNNEGYITTFHTESGKTFWKLLNNGENIPVINPK